MTRNTLILLAMVGALTVILTLTALLLVGSLVLTPETVEPTIYNVSGELG